MGESGPLRILVLGTYIVAHVNCYKRGTPIGVYNNRKPVLQNFLVKWNHKSQKLTRVIIWENGYSLIKLGKDSDSFGMPGLTSSIEMC